MPVKQLVKGITEQQDALDVGGRNPYTSLDAVTYLRKNNIMVNFAAGSVVHLISMQVF